MLGRDVLQLALSFVVFGGAAYYMRAKGVEPGSPLGHGIGVLGTLLIFGLLPYYSMRRRMEKMKEITTETVLDAHVFFLVRLLFVGALRGRSMRWLLKMHILMGLIGPALVAAHTGLRFHGLAGLSAFLMLVVVASGFFGRYVLGRIPGVTIEAELHLLERDKKIALEAASVEEIERLETEMRELRAQLKAIRHAKELLSNWRAVHIPLTTLFFITMILHVVSVFYY